MNLLRNNLVIKIFSVIIILITAFAIFSCKNPEDKNIGGDGDGDETELSENKCPSCSGELDGQGNCPSCSNGKHECNGKDCDGNCITPLNNCKGKGPKFTCSNCKKNMVDQENSRCQECNNKNTKCNATSCKGNKPLKDQDANGICPDCSAKGKCSANACKGDIPIKDHDNKGICSNCYKKSKCNANACKGDIPLKDHDNDGICADCKKDIKCKATNGLCEGKHPLNKHDDQGFCPDCIANTKCKADINCEGNNPKKDHDNKAFCPTCSTKSNCNANDCKGNCPPKEFDEKGYCKECRKIKSKCKAGINCKGNKLRKDHDEDGFCSDCNNNTNCKSGFCGGKKPLKDHNDKGHCTDCIGKQSRCNADSTAYPCDGKQLLKDHNDKGYCTDCLDKNHKCNKDPHSTCPGDKLLKEHDENGICPSCNDKKVHCRFSSCSNSTVAFKDFDSNGYCAACGAKKQACKANHPNNICPGNQLLKDHDENGICSDCSADKTKKLKIDMMDFRDLKPLIEKFKDLDVGIQQSDIDSLDDSKINEIRTYFTELQRLGIYKGTIGERDVIDLNNTSFIDTNFNKSSLGSVYHLVGNTWTSKLASTYTNLRLKKPFKITDKAFRLLMDHTLTFVFIEGTGDSITVLIKSTEIT